MSGNASQQRTWAAVEIEAKPDQEDLASWLLMQCGAHGCEVEPKGASTIRITATFEGDSISDADWEKIKSSLEEYCLGESLKTLKRKDVPEEDWLAKWKEGFEPFRVGTKFLICPSWYQQRQGNEKAPEIDAELREGRFLIYIEPGMAFGTGLHATTQFCLRALESVPPKGKILDVGTGSGILAIASLMLEPGSEIAACDIDPVAVDFARTDFELNGVDGRIELFEGSTDKMIGRRFDMLLSNLTCEDIIALLPDYNKLLNPEGFIIGAGVLAEKLPLLEQAIVNYPLRIVQSEMVGQWAGVVIQKA
ncbi:MAG: 50S ribosomal protein L11 methyltransferase [Cyanobacteria bacterium SZAS LIN-2]|nr:50S ribosomal protein L11 methyltransferase [Cyanobacteria bacterium SZAS LIN-3]MBS1995733.1 50S ribosomal protein L11 methyltransferase [Cyanobacteria bacterium SZAS LIN-2]